MRRAFLAVSAILASSSTAFSASNGAGPSTGAQIAQTVCVQCHAVGADESKHSPDPQAPRFRDVANMPSTTELSLKVFLQSSHRNMPNLMLDENEINSITTYILALRHK